MLSYVKLLLIKHAKTPYRNNTYVNLPTTTLLLFPGLGLAINKYMTLSTDTSVGTMDEKKKKRIAKSVIICQLVGFSKHKCYFCKLVSQD